MSNDTAIADALRAGATARFEFHSEALDIPVHLEAITLEEHLTQTYEAVVQLRTTAAPPPYSQLLGKDCVVTIERAEVVRSVRGVMRHVSASPESDTDGSLEVHIVPALWMLGRNRDSRIFQQLTAPEVVAKVYAQRLGGLERRLRDETRHTYPTYEYIVQYQESDYDFICRILERDGIFFYFDHDDAESEHEVLVLADSSSGLAGVGTAEGRIPFAPDDTFVWQQEAIAHAAHAEEIGPSQVEVRGYDWTHPTLDVSSRNQSPAPSDPPLEVYEHDNVRTHEYGGDAYSANTAGSDSAALSARSVTSRQHWELSGSVTDASPGRVIEPEGSDLEGRFVIVSHAARGRATLGEGGTYGCQMECVPAADPLYSRRLTPRPHVAGPETAVVVGPAGEEIFTDEHGRVKVQMHWDREGQRDDKSSCWMRVTQSWTGPGFGTWFVPRIGMEVVVSFLGGDPDRPLITGCLYNGDNRVGVDLPAKKTQSLIRTKSSPRSDGFNEMRFEDEAGNEFIYVHAEKDYNEEVEHDHSTHVKNNQSNTVDVDQTETVGNDQRMTVHNDRFHTVDHDEWVEVGHYRSEIVHGNEDWVIEGQRARTVKDDELLTVQDGHRKIHVQTGKDLETFDGGREVKVKAFDNLKVLDGANRNEHITGQYNVTVDGAHYTLVQGETEKFTQGSQKTYVESAKEVHAKTGSSHLLMKNDGKIKLAGDTKIELEVGACKIEMTTEKITLSAGSSSIELGPSGVTTSGSTVTSSAQTMNEITGLLVKIN